MASDTALAESAQAFFCAVADYVGIAEAERLNLFDISPKTGRPTYADFKDYWNSTPAGKRMSLKEIYKSKQITVMEGGGPLPFEQIEGLIKPNTAKAKGWYKSSMNIAHALLLKIQTIDKDFSKIKGPDFSDILYRRGTKEVMGTIEDLFKIAKKNTPAGGITFGDVNKWSPADIYLASDKSIAELKTIHEKNKNSTSFGFVKLNSYIAGLIRSGDLLPLSLKKQTNPANVVLEKVNFSRKDEQKRVAKLTMRCTVPAGKDGWVVYKGTTVFEKGLPHRSKRQRGNTGERRDVFLHIDAKTAIQFRHEATNPGTLKVEVKIKGGGGRGGSVGSLQSFVEVLKRVGKGCNTSDGKAFGALLTSKYNAARTQYHAIVKSETMTKRYKEGKAAPKMPGKNISAETEAYLIQAGDASGRTMANAIMPCILKWLHEGTEISKVGLECGIDDSRTKEFIDVMYRHITSRVVDADGKMISARFVIAK